MTPPARILALCLVLAATDAARADIGPTDAVPAALVPDIAACMAEADTDQTALTCLDRDGVTDAARTLAAALRDQTALGLPGILVDVTETGPVDVARVVLPALSTGETHAVLVNGLRDAALVAELAFAERPPDTPGTRAIRAVHPDATETSRVAVVAHRVLQGGAQRFVIADRVTEGCPTCAEVGVALTYLDVVRGALVDVERLGWFPPAPPPEEIAARLDASDIAVLQARLTALGYDPGPVDGAVGPRTRGAFYALKRDLCLAEDPTIRPVITVLAAPAPDLAPPPCAPEVFTRPPDPAAGTRPAP